MTVPARSSLARRGLSSHLHTPARVRFTVPLDSRVRPDCAGTMSGMGDTRLPVIAESPFAPARCYILGSRVDHDFDQHYLTLPNDAVCQSHKSLDDVKFFDAA